MACRTIVSVINNFRSPRTIAHSLLIIILVKLSVYVIIDLPLSHKISLGIIVLGYVIEYYDTNKCNIIKNINYIKNNKVEFIVNRFFTCIVISVLMFFSINALNLIDTYIISIPIIDILVISPIYMIVGTVWVSDSFFYIEGMGHGNASPPSGGPGGGSGGRGGPWPGSSGGRGGGSGGPSGGPGPENEPPFGPRLPDSIRNRLPKAGKLEDTQRFYYDETYQKVLPDTIKKLEDLLRSRPRTTQGYFDMSSQVVNDAHNITPLDHNAVCHHLASHPVLKQNITLHKYEGEFVYRGPIDPYLVSALKNPKIW